MVMLSIDRAHIQVYPLCQTKGRCSVDQGSSRRRRFAGGWGDGIRQRIGNNRSANNGQDQGMHKSDRRAAFVLGQPSGPKIARPPDFWNCRGQRGWKRVLSTEPLVVAKGGTSLRVLHGKGRCRGWALLQECPGTADSSCLWWLELLCGLIQAQETLGKDIRSLGSPRTKTGDSQQKRKLLKRK